MVTVIIGGSGSGKSEYAENQAVQFIDTRLFYLATMQPFDQESLARIERHQYMRLQKQFQTIECYTKIDTVILPQKSTLLLECMSNLVANEMFSENGAKYNTFEAVKGGLEYLMVETENLIVVTNQVFSDGIEYDTKTREYLKTLGKLNQWISFVADKVIQVVCGIPVTLKPKRLQ